MPNDVYREQAFQRIIHRAILETIVCVRDFPPLSIRFISSLFITITHLSTVKWTSGCGTLHSITLQSPICPGNFPVPLRPNLPILLPLRLHLSVTDGANTGKQTAGLTSNRIRDCEASAQSLSRSPSLNNRPAQPVCLHVGVTLEKLPWMK